MGKNHVTVIEHWIVQPSRANPSLESFVITSPVSVALMSEY